MKSNYAKKPLLIAVVLILFGLLLFISHNFYSPNLFEKFNNDIDATQTAMSLPLQLPSAIPNLFASPATGFVLTVPPTPTATPSPTLNSYEVIGVFLTQTSVAQPPVLIDPMAQIVLFATQTAYAQTVTASGIENQPLFLTPISTSATVRPTGTPHSILITLTANSYWQTAQVAAIQETSYPAIETAAADMIGTATSISTPVPTATLAFPSNATNDLPGNTSIFGIILKLLDDFSFDDGTYNFLVWLLPGFITAVIIENAKKRIPDYNPQNIGVSLLVFYTTGLSLTFLNDKVNFDFKFSEIADSSAASLIIFSVLLSIVSIFFTFLVIEMAKGFNIQKLIPFLKSFSRESSPDLGSSLPRQHFLTFGIGIVAAIDVFSVLSIGYFNSYYASPGAWFFIVGILPLIYVLVIELTDPRHPFDTWGAIFNALLLPFVGLYRLLASVFGSFFTSDVVQMSWGGILIKYIVPTLAMISSLYYFIPIPAYLEYYLPNQSLTLIDRLFFLPYLLTGRFYILVQSVLNHYLKNFIFSYVALPDIAIWGLACVFIVLLLIWLIEIAVRTTSNDQWSGLFKLHISQVTKAMVDIYISWYLLAGLFIVLLGSLARVVISTSVVGKQNSGIQIWLVIITSLLFFWGYRYSAITIKKTNVILRKSSWYFMPINFLATIFFLPILAIGKITWKFFNRLLNTLFFFSIFTAGIFGSYPDLLASVNLPLSSASVTRLISIVHEYDFLFRLIVSGEYTPFYIAFCILAAFLIWVASGVYIKQFVDQRASFSESLGKYLLILLETFNTWILALVVTLLGTRYLNLLLFIMPSTPSSSFWLSLLYALFAALILFGYFSYFLSSEMKASLLEVLFLPVKQLVSKRNQTDQLEIFLIEISKYTALAKQVFKELVDVLKFLLLPYPINRGKINIRIPQLEERTLKFTLIVGEGFYFEQSLLFSLIIVLLSWSSSEAIRGIFQALVFSASLFVLWFYLKQTYENNIFQSHRLLFKLAGVALIAYSITWVVWHFLIPLIYTILLALGTQVFTKLGTVQVWLNNNKPFPYVVELIFLITFSYLARNLLFHMWKPVLDIFLQDIRNLISLLQRQSITSTIKTAGRVIRYPKTIPDDLPKSFFVAWGILFYVVAFLLLLVLNIYIQPYRNSLNITLGSLLGSIGSMFVIIPFLSITASNPTMYMKYYSQLLAGFVERFYKRGEHDALDIFLARTLLFSGYRKVFQYFCLIIFFAHGLFSLVFEPLRILLLQFPGWSTFVLLMEIFFTLSLASLLISNFIRISPILTVFIGTIFGGFSFLTESSSRFYLIGFAFFIFIIGLGNYQLNRARWTSEGSFLKEYWLSVKRIFFNLDALEFAQSKFSDLVIYVKTEDFFESVDFQHKFEAAIKECTPSLIDYLASMRNQMQDPIRQCLILYAYSNIKDFQAFADRLIILNSEKATILFSPSTHEYIKTIVLHLLLMTRENLDDALSVLSTHPQSLVDISPILISEILPLPLGEGIQEVADFPGEERNILEIYTNKEKTISDVLDVWAGFTGESIFVKELCDLYSLMLSMNQINKIDEIATFSLSMRDRTVLSDSIFNELYQTLVRITAIADIVARANIQRPNHRSHEYSFALKQIQSVYKSHLAKLGERERTYLSVILDLWSILLTESLIYEPSLPHLSLSMETTQLKAGLEEILVIVIANEGESTASDLEIDLIPSKHLEILSPDLPYRVDEVLGRSSVRLELNVILSNSDDADLKISLSYKDLRQKQYSIPEIVTKLSSKLSDQITLPFGDSIANPYVYGPAVTDADHFFGREKTLQAIDQRLRDSKQTSIIMLYGQRRMGKSSILKKIYNRYSQMENWWPIYIDGATIFAKKVPELMLALAVRIWSRLPEGHSLPNPDLASFQIDPGHALVDQFLPSVDKVVKERGKLLLILFDEFDTFVKTAQARFKHEEVQEVLWVIREFAQQMSTGGFVYAGTYELLDMSRYYHAPLFNLAEQIKVGPLERDDAQKLISVPGSPYLQFNEDATQKIMRLSGCHPYFIQLLCNKIFDAASNENLHGVGVRLVNKALTEAQEQENAFFNIWSERNDDQRLTLSALAQIIEYDGFMAPVTRIHNILELGFVSIEIDLIQNAVDRLVQEEILQNENDLYGFSVDLLRLWIRARKSLPSVRAEIGYRI